MVALNRQKTSKKVYSLVLDTVQLPIPEMLTDEHDGEAVHSFVNACKTNSKLTGLSNTNTQAILIKTRLNKTAGT